MKVQRALEQVGIDATQKEAIHRSLFPATSRRLVRIPRKTHARILAQLEKTGKCGLQLTDSGRLYVVSAEHVTFTNFNFQRPEVLQKAIDAKRNGANGKEIK